MSDLEVRPMGPVIGAEISINDCVAAGGTVSQPYTSQGDFGWYCVGAYLGAPPRITAR